MDTMNRIAKDSGMEELSSGEMLRVDGGIIAVLIGLRELIPQDNWQLLPAVQKFLGSAEY